MTSTTTPQGVVDAMLTHFLEGRTDAMLEQLADDIEWLDHSPSISGLRGRWVGKTDVLNALDTFDGIAEINDVSVTSVATNADTVFALLDLDFSVRSSNRSYRGPLVMVHTVRDGRVGRVEIFPSESEALYQ